MEHEFMEICCELALDIQTVVKAGWELEYKQGDRRLGITASMIARKGKHVHMFFTPSELEGIVRVLWDKDNG